MKEKLELLKLLADETRLEILNILLKEDSYVEKIACELSLTPATICYHLKKMEAAGADLITVHGRTRQQFYAPFSDNRVIRAVKQAVKIPVVGNGDLFCAQDVRRMREETECDGVMIARGAMGNPFFFSEIVAMDEGKPYTPPTDKERIDTALFHAADMVKRKGERTGLAEARKHMLWYCKGLRGAAAAREALTHARSLDEIRAVLYALIGME